MIRHTHLSLILILVILVAGVSGADEALVRIERQSPADRNALVDRDLTLVAEMDKCFLAFGDPPVLSDRSADLGLLTTVIDGESSGQTYAIASFGQRPVPDQLDACGEVIFTGDQWAILRVDSVVPAECHERTDVWFRLLRRKPLRRSQETPVRWQGFSKGRDATAVDPLVEGMVMGMTDDLAMVHWQGIIDMASTRYSTSAGCETAATAVGQVFSGLGLSAEYQDHTTNHAPNVIGTLPGTDLSDEIVVLVGHLDSLPSSGLAPGADDNASGSAMVTALAEVMSCSTYRRTVRFLAVTGEEFGLYGSDYHAGQAASQGEQLTAVLNADMIGWDGDGYPAVEDLDINQNTASEWLGNLFAQMAEDYQTGTVVNNFTCNSMASSDHWPFWEEGFPALCGITDNFGFCGQGGEIEDYPYYHQSSDTLANCGPGAPAFIGSAMRTYLATAAVLAEPIASVVSSSTGIQATADGANQVVVSWTPPEPGMVHQVRRMPGGCSDPGPATFLTQTTDTTFTDSSASGGVTYGYEVRSIESNGPCASAWSECVEAVTTGDCTEPPQFAGAGEAVNQETVSCGVELSWQPAQIWCGDTASYSIYRSTDPDFVPGPDTLVASDIAGSPWLDDGDLAPNVTNYWIVQAIDGAGGGADGNTVRRAARPTGPVAMGTWLDDAQSPGEGFLELETPWQLLETEGLNGSDAYGTDGYPSGLCSAGVTPSLILGVDSTLTFWTRYDIEEDYDKGEVQISGDDGATWNRLELDYPMQATVNSSDACGLPANHDYFTGTNLSWSSYTASLAAWAGQPVRVRWVLSSDGYIEQNGWWLDDLSITPAGVPGMCVPAGGDGIFSDGFETGDADAWDGLITAP